MNEEFIIGIDLGSSNSSVALYVDGKIHNLHNRSGKETTPSCVYSGVYFTEKKTIIPGNYALQMADKNPDYLIYDLKRLIGRNLNDLKIQQNFKFFSFYVDNTNDTNEPIIFVKQPKKVVMRKTPLVAYTALLSKIKADVAYRLGEECIKAVITVPVGFSKAQREATLEAASKAGFTVLKLLPEPEAIAFRFCLGKKFVKDHHFLVYDLGGGGFNVAIFKKTSSNIEVVGFNGNCNLGGQDFDNLILDFVCQKQKITPDKRHCGLLRIQCEKAKKTLSDLDKAEIIFDQIKIEISRQQFEELADFMFKKTIEIVDNCLKSCNLSKTEIKKVILSGGSTRIPKIQELVADYFDSYRVTSSPEECVAEGAAIQAAMLSRHPNQKIGDLKIIDVT